MLTDEDRAELDRIQIAWTNSPASSDGTNGMRVLLETIAVHFLAAGAARARPAPAAEDDALVAGLKPGHHLEWCLSFAEGDEPACDCCKAERTEAADRIAALTARIAELEGKK